MMLAFLLLFYRVEKPFSGAIVSCSTRGAQTSCRTWSFDLWRAPVDAGFSVLNPPRVEVHEDVRKKSLCNDF